MGSDAGGARAWRNRIVGTGDEDAEQLLANPNNYRIHPQAQQKALAGVLDQVGWVQNVIVNQRTGYVVDGHARVAMAITRGERVPVVYVDLSEAEERLVIASLDPLAAMAVTDHDMYARLATELPAIDSVELVKALKAQSKDAFSFLSSANEAPRNSDSASDNRPAPDRIPLAIVLNTLDARRWREFKTSIGEEQDTPAFLELLSAAT